MSTQIKSDDVIFNFFKQICDEKNDEKCVELGNNWITAMETNLTNIEKNLETSDQIKHKENIDKNKKAWTLIKESGCENFKVGEASISQKHCNFFVNNGNAKSIDIENLIKKVKKTVYDKTGVNLELEVKIMGE